jgi:hypothetical protein
MRTRLIFATVGFLGVAAPTASIAGELYRLRVDLDGDRKVEIIEVSTTPAKDAWRSRVRVKIGAAKYFAEFFSAESDLPDIRVVSIDRKRPQRQLLLETPEAGTCIYHLLSYVENKLVPLLRFDSGPTCQPPQPQGNGHVSVSTWQGFWSKEIRYQLSSDGKALVEEPKTIYSVEVAGVAGKPLALQGAECPARVVPLGTYVRVKLYDSKNDRYRLQTTDGSCGWIPASDLNTLDEIVKELPWAG